MAETRYQNQRGNAPLNVEKGFRAYSDGSGNKAAALAKTLGVVMDATPKIAQAESVKAFEAGMRERVDGVKEENRGSTNDSMLGFMFSKRAADGFDYQDAQMAVPEIHLEEMAAMDALRESRNLNDFGAYIQGRDAILKERIGSRSDIYKYTVAENMMKVREEQGRRFASWVQSNRDKDRAAAAKAAAKAAAARAQLNLEEAARSSLDLAPDGINSDEWGEFVKTAPEKFGISSEQAKEVLVGTIIDTADETGDERILRLVDPKFLTIKQRASLTKAEDLIRTERVQRENYNHTLSTRQAEADKDRIETEATDALNEALKAGADPTTITQTALGSELGQSDPTKAMALANVYMGVQDAMVDPFVEAAVIAGVQEEIDDLAVQGRYREAKQVALEAATSGQVRSSQVSTLMGMTEASRVFVGETVQSNLRVIGDRLTADFQPKSTKPSEPQSPAESMAEQINGATFKGYDREVADKAHVYASQSYRRKLAEYSQENDVTFRDIPPSALNEMQEAVYIEAKAYTTAVLANQAAEAQAEADAEAEVEAVEEQSSAATRLQDRLNGN